MSAPQQQQQQQQQPQEQQAYNPEPEAYRNLMVNYIPTTVDEVQLRDLFARFGPIESVKIVCDRETRQSRGYGFVKYQTAASAQQAINELNGFSIMNKRLKVALAAAGNQRNRNNNNNGGSAGGNNMNYYGGYPAQQYGMNPYAAQQPMMPAMYAQQYMMQPQAQQAQAPQQYQ